MLFPVVINLVVISGFLAFGVRTDEETPAGALEDSSGKTHLHHQKQSNQIQRYFGLLTKYMRYYVHFYPRALITHTHIHPPLLVRTSSRQAPMIPSSPKRKSAQIPYQAEHHVLVLMVWFENYELSKIQI